MIEPCCKAFSPMGQKALLKTFAQSHEIKSFVPFFREIKEMQMTYRSLISYFSSN